MGLDRYNKTPCGFCFVEYYTHQDALDCLKYVGGTKLDERIIRTDLDPGFEEGRQYGYVEWRPRRLRATWIDNFLTRSAVGASLVDKSVMNIARNTTLAVGVTVEHTLMTSADGRKKSMEAVSNRGFGLELLAQIRRLYKDSFNYHKAEMKIKVYWIPPPKIHANAIQMNTFLTHEPNAMLQFCSSEILPLGAATMNGSSRHPSVQGGSLFQRHCPVEQQQYRLCLCPH